MSRLSGRVRIFARALPRLALKPLRGSVIVELVGQGTLLINDQRVDAPASAELALVPGLYRFSADFGAGKRSRLVTVKPGARLRLQLRP